MKKAGSEPGGCWVFVKNIFNQDCSPVSFIDNINFCITAIPNIVSYVTTCVISKAVVICRTASLVAEASLKLYH